MNKKVVLIAMIILNVVAYGAIKKNKTHEEEGRKCKHDRGGYLEPADSEGKTVDNDTTSILDKHVVAMAQSLQKDPNSYRLHMRTDVDGARIYRQVGKYIIVNPNGEVIYVPDRS